MLYKISAENFPEVFLDIFRKFLVPSDEVSEKSRVIISEIKIEHKWNYF